MRSFLPLALAVAALGGRAGAQDHQALAAELATLKKDADVLAYLEGDAARARRLRELEAGMQARLHLAQEYRAQAEDLRRLQAMARDLRVPGDRPESGSPDTTEDREAQELELRAAEQARIARETLVDLVAGYREVKALATARRKPGPGRK